MRARPFASPFADRLACARAHMQARALARLPHRSLIASRAHARTHALARLPALARSLPRPSMSTSTLADCLARARTRTHLPVYFVYSPIADRLARALTHALARLALAPARVNSKFVNS